MDFDIVQAIGDYGFPIIAALGINIEVCQGKNTALTFLYIIFNNVLKGFLECDEYCVTYH